MVELVYWKHSQPWRAEWSYWTKSWRYKTNDHIDIWYTTRIIR